MPIYLAICVIALELNNIADLNENYYLSVSIVTFFAFLIFHMSNIAYLNPVWYFMGKRIYRIESDSANHILIIDKKVSIKASQSIDDIIKIDEFVHYKRK
jgi:hypothetical protein